MLEKAYRIAIAAFVALSLSTGAAASSPGKLAAEAQLLFSSGKFEESLSIYRKALSSETSDKRRAILHFNSGCCLLATGKAEEARDEFVLALVTPDPSPKPVIIYNLAHALYEIGDREQALKSLRQCLILDPHLRDAKLYYEWILKQEPPEDEPPQEPPSDKPDAPPPPNLLEKLPSPPQKPAQDQSRPPEPPPAAGMKPW